STRYVVDDRGAGGGREPAGGPVTPACAFGGTTEDTAENGASKNQEARNRGMVLPLRACSLARLPYTTCCRIRLIGRSNHAWDSRNLIGTRGSSAMARRPRRSPSRRNDAVLLAVRVAPRRREQLASPSPSATVRLHRNRRRLRGDG